MFRTQDNLVDFYHTPRQRTQREPQNISTASDEVLVVLAQKGEERAFEQLIKRHGSSLHNHISRYLRNSHAVDDVFQEALIRAYRALPRFRGDASFYTWLYRIGINAAKNYIASESRKIRTSMVPLEHEDFGIVDRRGDEPTPEEVLSAKELNDALSAVVETMPADMRAVYTLRCTRGMSYVHIATTMGVPLGTVRSRLSRAREFLLEHLDDAFELAANSS